MAETRDPVQSWTELGREISHRTTTALLARMSPQVPFEWSRDKYQVPFPFNPSAIRDLPDRFKRARGLDAPARDAGAASVPTRARRRAAPLATPNAQTSDMAVWGFPGGVGLLVFGAVSGFWCGARSKQTLKVK